MKKNTSITIAVATILGLGIFASSTANAQRGNAYGHQKVNHPHYRSHQQHNPNLVYINNARLLDRTANQMINVFARDLRYNPGCRESQALMKHLRTYAGKTNLLVRATGGNCKTSVKKAACASRDALTCVQNQAKKVRNLNCAVKTSMGQSCPIATRLHSHADRFVLATAAPTPRPTYTTHTVATRTQPVTNTVNRNRGYHQQPQQTTGSLFGSFLRAVLD